MKYSSVPRPLACSHAEVKRASALQGAGRETLLIEEEHMTPQTILWRRLDQPGHEFARLSFQKATWCLTGTAVFAHQQQPCRLDYGVGCDAQWHTRSGRVKGWVGDTMVDIVLSVDAARRWWINGTACPAVTGCMDLDLNFSPSTNLLPIRRLSLAIGQRAEVKAAWLRFPDFTLEPLTQIYHRLDATTYRYESAGGRFVTELQVNADGFVTHYANVWRLEVDRYGPQPHAKA